MVYIRINTIQTQSINETELGSAIVRGGGKGFGTAYQGAGITKRVDGPTMNIVRRYRDACQWDITYRATTLRLWETTMSATLRLYDR